MTENSNDDYSTWHNDDYSTWHNYGEMNNQLRRVPSENSNDDYGCHYYGDREIEIEVNNQLRPHPSATFTDITFPTVNTDSDSYSSSGEDESSKFREHRSKVSILVLASLMLATCIVREMANSKNRPLQFIALYCSLGLAFFAYQWIFRFSDGLTTQRRQAEEPAVVPGVHTSYRSSTLYSLQPNVEEVRSETTQEFDEAMSPPPKPRIFNSNLSIWTESTQQDTEAWTRPNPDEVLQQALSRAYTPPGSPILRTPGTPPIEEHDGRNGNGNNDNGPGENAVQRADDGFDYGTSLSIGLMTTVAVTSFNQFLTELLRMTGPG